MVPHTAAAFHTIHRCRVGLLFWCILHLRDAYSIMSNNEYNTYRQRIRYGEICDIPLVGRTLRLAVYFVELNAKFRTVQLGFIASIPSSKTTYPLDVLIPYTASVDLLHKLFQKKCVLHVFCVSIEQIETRRHVRLCWIHIIQKSSRIGRNYVQKHFSAGRPL